MTGLVAVLPPGTWSHNRGRLLAAMAGAALPLSFAPFALYVVAPPAIAVLFGLCHVAPREAAWRGFCFGAAAFLAGTWWLYISVRLVGGTPLPVAILLLGGLIALMAGWVALCCYTLAWLRSTSLAFNACVLGPAAWVLVEWLRGWVLTGFPWLSLGYGQIDGPLAAWGPVGGVYAVSLLTAVLGGAFLVLARGTTRERAYGSAVLLMLALSTWAVSGRSWTVPEGAPLRVALVQGAVPQLLKWLPGERQATMQLYRTMTEELVDMDLVIWPEAAVPVPDSMARDYLDEMAMMARARDMQLLIGILTHDEERDEYRNSLIAVGQPGGAYHKRHLVPFGEFFPVPDFVRSWMRMMNLPYSDISRGASRQPPLMAADIALAPTICYEDAYGGEQLGFLPEARLLVNVSNDAWFGDTLAPHQHLQIARMRALETGRFMVRGTNTGITAIIDQRGAVRATIAQFVPGVLTGTVQPFRGATPYVRTGNWVVVLLALVGLAGAYGLRAA